MKRILSLIAAVILLITCSSCFWEVEDHDSGGHGDRGGGGYGEHGGGEHEGRH